MNLTQFLKAKSQICVLDKSIGLHHYMPIDLSENETSTWEIEFSNSSSCWVYMKSILAKNNATVLFGGYLEKRNLYDRSPIFDSKQVSKRNIHLGIDLWTEAGTSVLAALKGEVFGFADNLGLGNYGPTIILKHKTDGFEFYTLYGHLSKKSIKNLKIGTVFGEGEIIGFLGNAFENGDYAPHLHFQIINNIENYKNDYPGVCAKERLDYYEENCPNPNLLLKL
jgi:murein DD-endopeptidase MepM/ murein hydrolase activator NlpD